VGIRLLGGVTIFNAIPHFILLKVVDAVVGLCVDAEQEREGLDIVLRGEQVS
jgi:ammonia channel protein AmtB